MRKMEFKINIFTARTGPAVVVNEVILDRSDAAGEKRRLSSSVLPRAAGNF